jgi:pseudouridylate synthase
MSDHAQHRLRIHDRVSDALERGRAVVALESTVIAHGLPYPLNIEVASACEETIERAGAIPATIGIVEGAPTIGLDKEELMALAQSTSSGLRVEKVGLNNMAGVVTQRRWGATTVAATMRLACEARISVFATGGIGGVHRGASETFDVSADLIALGSIPVACVCAGPKAILDLPKTAEYLETLGVPVIGFQTDELPAFYSRSSRVPVDTRVESAEEAASVASNHWRSGGKTGVLICVPVPPEFEIPAEEVARSIERALVMAEEANVRGKKLTPFLLSKLEELTEGVSLRTNRALLINNAGVAAKVALSIPRPGAAGV